MKNKSKSSPPAGGWFYGTKHEWVSCKINCYSKSNRNYWCSFLSDFIKTSNDNFIILLNPSFLFATSCKISVICSCVKFIFVCFLCYDLKLLNIYFTHFFSTVSKFHKLKLHTYPLHLSQTPSMFKLIF